MTSPAKPERTSESAASFLIAEHERLGELYLSIRESADRRVNLFLTLTTTIVGVVVALSQLQLAPLQLVETALAAAIGIFLLGVITFNRLLERSMQSTEYLRAINRLHHYFIERAPDAAPYLFWPAYDDIPRYDSRGVGGADTREVILIIDCIFFGIAVGLAWLVLTDLAQIVSAIIVGVVALVIAFLAHSRFEQWLLDREEDRKRMLVRFPSPRDQAVQRVVQVLEERTE